VRETNEGCKVKPKVLWRLQLIQSKAATHGNNEVVVIIVIFSEWRSDRESSRVRSLLGVCFALFDKKAVSDDGDAADVDEMDGGWCCY
jgi:hypothetical protein